MTRSEAEAQIRRYFATQGKYRQLTRREYRWRAETPALPSDSVQSPALSGMPMAHGTPSDATLRVVMTREEILERRQQALAELAQQLDRLQDELLQMVELWAILTPIQRWLMDLYYWRNLPQEDVAQWFVRHQTDFDGWRVPTTEYAVRAALEDILGLAQDQWTGVEVKGSPELPPGDPA